MPTFLKAKNVTILAVAITTIECDGHSGVPCPNDAVVEFARPQSVAIRLAQNSGWTVWVETMCPECSNVPSSAAPTAPAIPSVLPVIQTVSRTDEASNWRAEMADHMARLPAAV